MLHPNIYASGKTRLLPPLGFLEADTGTHKTAATYYSVIERSRFNVQIVVCGKKAHLDEWEEGLHRALEKLYEPNELELAKSKVTKVHEDCIDKNQRVFRVATRWLEKRTSSTNVSAQ